MISTMSRAALAFMAGILFATAAPSQSRPIDPLRPRGTDTMDDFQSVCFGNAGAGNPVEVYWAGVCRYQKFEDGSWRIITSASPDGPIRRTFGPVNIRAILEWEDVTSFPLSLFMFLGDWGNVFLGPRDLDVQSDIGRRVQREVGADPDAEIAVLIERQDGELTVTNFIGRNFTGGNDVNLVEISFRPQVVQTSVLRLGRSRIGFGHIPSKPRQ